MFKKMFGGSSDKKDKKEEKKDKKEKKSTNNDDSKKKNEGHHKSRSSGDGERRSKPKAAKKTEPKATGKRKKVKREVKVDFSQPIEYPCVPEILLEYHRNKPMLKPNEEWLLVELAEFECLIENIEILQIMAKHSKFFELDPPEMVEEFFEFVDDVPSYDEVINYDVWQEFRDKKYPC